MGNQLGLLWTLETGIIRHKLLVGAELSRLTDVFTLEFTGGTAVQLDNTSVEVPSQQTGFRQFFQNVDASAVTIAPYILDRIELHPKAELLLGGRLDVLTYEDERSQQFFDLLETARLAQKCKRMILDRGQRRLKIGFTGQDDGFDRRANRSRTRDHFGTLDAGHVQIDDHAIKRFTFKCRNRGFAIGTDDDAVTEFV